MTTEIQIQGAPLSAYVNPEGEYAASLTRWLEYFANGDVIDDCEGVDSSERFLLIETSRYGGAIFATSWASVEEALDYHDGQEYPEDWDVEAVYDLHNGNRYTTVTTTMILVNVKLY